MYQLFPKSNRENTFILNQKCLRVISTVIFQVSQGWEAYICTIMKSLGTYGYLKLKIQISQLQ